MMRKGADRHHEEYPQFLLLTQGVSNIRSTRQKACVEQGACCAGRNTSVQRDKKM